MVDFDPNSPCSARQLQLIAVIAHWAPQFLSQIDAATPDERNADLVSEARSLLAQLNQNPADGADAVHRDLESRIAATGAFLQEFESVETAEGSSVVEQARVIHKILVSLKNVIEISPHATPDTRRRSNPDLENDEKKYHSAVGTPVMYAVMAGILAARWLGYWKASWLIVIPVAYVAGAVAAGILSTIIRTVRGY